MPISNDRPSPHPSPLGGEGKGEGVWDFEFGSFLPAGKQGIWCLSNTLNQLPKFFLIRKVGQVVKDRLIFLHRFELKLNP